MKPVLRLLSLLLAFALVACQGPGSGGPGTKDPQPPTGVITGVLTSSDGTPAAGAQITLGGGITTAALEPAAASLGFANERGEFAFDVEDEGEYTLTTLSDDEGAFVRVTVTRNADGQLSSAPVVMQAAELGAVAGRVETSGPSAWAYLLGTSFLANTDHDGAFVISRVPAGSYLLAPGLLGVTGTAVPVTVQAGQVTPVTQPLRFGPVIREVEPGGFIASTQNPDTGLGEPERMTIRGSGFGESIGVAQLRYAGVDVSDHVLSWTDTEIVIDTNFYGAYRVVAIDDLRFSFANVAGQAYSEPGGIVHSYMSEGHRCGGPETGWIGADLSVFGIGVQGAQIALTVVNGTARTAPGGQVVSTVTTGETGCAQAFIQPDSTMLVPVIVTATFEGIELGLVVTRDGVHLELLDNVVFPGLNTLHGRLLQADTFEPMEDDGNYTAVLQCLNQPDTRLPLNLDSLGQFQLTVQVPAGGSCYQLGISYGEGNIAWTYLFTDVSGPGPTQLKPAVDTVMALDDTFTFDFMSAEAVQYLEWNVRAVYDSFDLEPVYEHYDGVLWDMGFDSTSLWEGGGVIEGHYSNSTTGVWAELQVRYSGNRAAAQLMIYDPRTYLPGEPVSGFGLTHFQDWDVPVYPNVDLYDVDWDFRFYHPASVAQEAFDHYDEHLQDLGWSQTTIDNDDDEWEADYRQSGVHLELEVEDDGGQVAVEVELNKMRFYTARP